MRRRWIWLGGFVAGVGLSIAWWWSRREKTSGGLSTRVRTEVSPSVGWPVGVPSTSGGDRAGAQSPATLDSTVGTEVPVGVESADRVEVSAKVESPAGGRRSRRRRNVPLWLGGTLVVLLAVWAFFGPLVAPHDPLARARIVQDETGAWHTSPLDPMEIDGYVLGTDHDGRDILSRLLWAMRPTLYLAVGAAIAWLAFGTTIGFVAGWLDGRGRWTATSMIDAAAATPLLILAIIVLYFLGEERSIRQFVVALSVTGWASTAQLVAVQVRSLRREGYVEAARSLGASDAHIARHHVLPHLLPLAPVVLAFQVGTVLLILGELGFLGFYVGGGEARSLPDPNSPGFFTKVIPGQPELAQMLGVGWDNFFQQPWLSVWAGAAFFLAVFAFMLFGEGIKRAVEV